MPTFHRSTRHRWLGALLFVLAALAVLYLPFLSVGEQKLYALAIPLSKIGYYTGVGTHDFLTKYDTLVQLREENDTLSREVRALREEMAKHAQLVRENEDLRAAMGILPESADWKFIPARIIGREPFLNPSLVRIAVGGNVGVAQGDPALGEGIFLVGKVIEVHDMFATVAFLTEERSAIPATLAHDDPTATEAIGLIESIAGLGLEMNYIPMSLNLAAGDAVITAGLDERIPYGLPIGRLEDITHPPNEVFQTAKGMPYVSFASLSELVIVHIP